MKAKIKAKLEYWTVYRYGGNNTLCTKHRRLPAARKAAKACERLGGSKHRILEVRDVT